MRGCAGAPACNPLESFTDIRQLQQHVQAQGVQFLSEVDESGTPPGSFLITDPDGNPILVDQHP